MMPRFASEPVSNRLALITGTTSGIGAALCRILLERGWSVLGVARRAAVLDHPLYRHLQLDLKDHAELVRRFEAEVGPWIGDARWERVGLVNNAANPEGLKLLARLSVEELHAIYDVNTIAPIWLIGFVLRSIRPGVALRIVNVSSGAASRGIPGMAAYSGSKAALRLVGMSLASEWDQPTPWHQVPADAAILDYEPGAVDTDMQAAARALPPEEFPWAGLFREMAARGRLQPPEAPALDLAGFLESARQPSFTQGQLKP
jgi:benzil reductase ((S)-benzoin forming)